MGGERRTRTAIGALALVGLAISSYIAIAEAGGGAPVCVAGSGGCEAVAASRYSELAGINVALIGIAGYVAILIGAAVRGDAGRFAGFVLALIGFGFSAYLTYLELFEIEAICQWCVASAVVMTLLAVATGYRALRFAGT